MSPPAELGTLMRRIHAFYQPAEIWLFGSRARGEARPTSDWDLMIVVPDDTPDDRLGLDVGWRLQEGSGVYADLVCCRERAFRREMAIPNTTPFEVGKDGVLLYSRAAA